jgi:hypothetical protein
MPAPTAAAPAPPARRPFTPTRLAALYRTHLVRTDREHPFLAWASFSVTFVAVRFVTHSIRAHRFRWLFHDLPGGGGRHIHHLVFGIAGLLVGGYLGTAAHPQRAGGRRGLALLYGASAALTIDEFALWSDLQAVYWTKDGRVSVHAAILTGALIGVGSTARHLLVALAADAVTLLRRAVPAQNPPAPGTG